MSLTRKMKNRNQNCAFVCVISSSNHDGGDGDVFWHDDDFDSFLRALPVCVFLRFPVQVTYAVFQKQLVGLELWV